MSLLNFINRFKLPARLYLALLVIFAPKVLLAQQAFSYTQYSNNLTPYNSAYALIGMDNQFNLLGRKQWVGIEGAPSSLVLNGHLHSEDMRNAGGVIVLHDRVAIEQLTDVNFFFARSIQLDERQFLAVSLNGGVRHYSANNTSVDAFDPKFQNNIRQTSATAGFGILFYNPDRYYAGVSIPRFNMKNLGSENLADPVQRNTWFFSAAYIFDVDNDIKLKPATLVAYASSVPVFADISASLLFKEQFGIGANIRTNNQVAGSLMYGVNNLRFTYSYQTAWGGANNGYIRNSTHEVGIGYRFGYSMYSSFKFL